MAKVRILISRDRVIASREAGRNLGAIMIYPIDRQCAPRYVKGVRGKGEWALVPEFGTGNVHGYADHICLIAEESEIDIIE